MAALSLVRRAVRQLPAAAVAFMLVHLIRGGFRGLDSLDWSDAAAVLLLLGGVGISGFRRIRRSAVGASQLLRDNLELGGCLVAAAYVLVSIGGAALFPVVYLLMAFLISFLPPAAGLPLLGVSFLFDGLITLAPPDRSVPAFLSHA